MKRSHECVFDDSSRKSRTQTLREKLRTLEAKVRELEYQPGPSNHASSSRSDERSSSSASSSSFSSHAELHPHSYAEASASNTAWENTMDSTLFPTGPGSFSVNNHHSSSLGHSSNSSPSQSDVSFSPPLNQHVSIYPPHPTLMDVPSGQFQDHGWREGPNIYLTPEIHKSLYVFTFG